MVRLSVWSAQMDIPSTVVLCVPSVPITAPAVKTKINAQNAPLDTIWAATVLYVTIVGFSVQTAKVPVLAVAASLVTF